MHEFEKGDRVRYVGTGQCTWPEMQGMTGTVTGVDDMAVEVDLDLPVEGRVDVYWFHDNVELYTAVPEPVIDRSELITIPDDTPLPTVRGSVLAEADGLIHGERNVSYGPPTENFDRIAKIWTVQLGNKLADGASISAEDVALLNIGLKLARAINQGKRDNFVDIAGYAACGEECRVAENDA